MKRKCILRQVSLGLAATSLAMGAAAQSGPASSYTATVLAIQDSIEKGAFVEAEEMVDRALVSYPLDAGLENLRGVVEVEQGETKAAARDFRAAIRHKPRLSSAYLNLARIELRANTPGSRAAALTMYKQVLSYDPKNPEANYQAATLLMRERRYPQSLEHLAKLELDRQALDGPVLVRCADEAGLGHAEDAEKACAQAAQSSSLSEEEVAVVSAVIGEAHRPDLIEVLLAAAQRLQALSPKGLRALAGAQEAQGKLVSARVTFERAFSSDPTSVDTLVDLARVANAQGEFQDALGYLAHARAQRPKDGSLAYSFALVCLRLNLLGEAHKALQEALDSAPNDADYNLAMGRISMYMQDPLASLPYLMKYHSMRPGDASAQLALGTAYYRAKDFAAAIPWLREAASSPSTAAEAHFYLGNLFRQQGKYEDALTELTLSLRNKPDQPEAEASLGQLYLQQRKYDLAERSIERAFALDPNSYAANFGLLQLYTHNGDPRREEQSLRLENIKAQQEQQAQQAMRTIEVRPQSDLPTR